MPASLLADRIGEILREQQLKQADLARVAGVTRGLVHQWIAGPSKTMSYDPAKRLNARYGYRIDWLMHGAGMKHDKDQPPPMTVQDPVELEVLRDFRALQGDEAWKLTVRLLLRVPVRDRPNIAHELNALLAAATGSGQAAEKAPLLRGRTGAIVKIPQRKRHVRIAKTGR